MLSRERKKKRNWQEFERFTGRIEAALAPFGAVIKCPDHVADIDTGQLRQIDATLRFPAVASKALVCFECRDRDTKQDVRWIEELYGKQRSIGASLMVAVSSKPFYAPAVKKAETLGIELRIMTATSAADFAAWLKTDGFTVDVNEYEICDAKIELFSGLADEPFDKLKGGNFSDAPAFLEVATNRRFSIGHIVERVRNSRRGYKRTALPNDATETVVFQPNQMQVSVGGRMQDVRAMRLELMWTKKKEFMPFSRLSSYASPTEEKAAAVEAEFNGVTLGIYRDAATGEKHIRFDSQRPARVVSVVDEEVSNANGAQTRRRTYGLQVLRPAPTEPAPTKLDV